MSKYDLVIVGGGTAGCATAYMAGKLKLKTLLIEKSGVLGGSMTSGLVMPAMKSSENQINTDFMDALIKEMKKIGGQVDYMGNSGWFNPELLKIALDNLMSETNVKVLHNTTVLSIQHSCDRIISLSLYNELLSPCTYSIDNLGFNDLSVSIDTKYLVDATGNAEIFKNLNCEFLQNNEEETQPFSLRFIMSGIDLEAYSQWLLDIDKNEDVTTVQHIDGVLHLSTACTWDKTRKWALLPIFKAGVANGLLKPDDINYFQTFTVPGMPNSLAFNCPRLVNCEGTLDIENISKALQEGRSTIFRLSEFFKKYFPGFKKSYISNISDMLGIRASRRIKGKYIYKMDDIINGTEFDKPVAISNYPIDVHSSDKDGSTLKKVGDYQIPLEALMSKQYDNLFAVGRCISADFMAQGAIRVQPTCFSMGVGLAKYLAKLCRH